MSEMHCNFMINRGKARAQDLIDLGNEVKRLVKEKCLEKIAGPYSLIADFTRARGSAPQTGVPPPHDGTKEGEGDGTLAAAAAEEPDLSSDLYSSGTVFRFYSKSADKPKPGKGEGETLGPEGSAAYVELGKIPQWRKKLSNFWPAEFKLDGHKWLSVEHYYQGSKFKKNNKDFYIQFSLDAKDSAIAKDAALAEAAGGNTGKYKGEVVRPKDIKVDGDFFAPQQGSAFTRAEQELESALRAKFTQQADLKELLIATGKAKLEHIRQSKPAEVMANLMRVRRELVQV